MGGVLVCLQFLEQSLCAQVYRILFLIYRACYRALDTVQLSVVSHASSPPLPPPQLPSSVAAQECVCETETSRAATPPSSQRSTP